MKVPKSESRTEAKKSSADPEHDAFFSTFAPSPPRSAYSSRPHRHWHAIMCSVDEEEIPTSSEEALIHFAHPPAYDEFFRRCLNPNRPCILPPSLVSHWNVFKSSAWSLASNYNGLDTRVDWNALKQLYGSHVSPVVITRTLPDSQTEDERKDMSIAAAVDLIHSFHQDPGNIRSIYIKDWHLIKQLDITQKGEDQVPYTVPEVFADDWMNNIPAAPTAEDNSSADAEDDFRFVYAGTAGSQTLLHRDVYTSYSWSTNVVGRKRWWLFPPQVIPHLRRFPKVATSELIPDIATLTSLLASHGDRRDFPELEFAWSKVQIIDQEQGETIFVPSNWYHQVQNLTDAVSINRNWCNSVNLPSLYRSITEELAHVENSLSDVREMLREGKRDGEWEGEFYELVQDVAVKDAGWAWDGFWKMVARNLKVRPTSEELRPKDGWMRKRLMPLVDDFEKREDARWLKADIREMARECKRLLEEMGIDPQQIEKNGSTG